MNRGESKLNNRGGKRPDYRLQELIGVINQYPITMINGRGFAANDKKQMINFLRNDLLSDDEIYLVLDIKPSDPDFPFDLSALKISLCVPKNYPMKKNRDDVNKNRPSIVVLNDEIPKGIGYNIEVGFGEIVAKSCMKKINKNDEIQLAGAKTLVGILQTLDVYLHTFLAKKKRDTIKIVNKIPKKVIEQPAVKAPLEPLTSTPSVSSIKDFKQRIDAAKAKLNNLPHELKFVEKTTNGEIYGFLLNSPSDWFVENPNNSALKKIVLDLSGKKLIAYLLLPYDSQQPTELKFFNEKGEFFDRVVSSFNEEAVLFAQPSILAVLNYLNTKFYLLGALLLT